MRTTLASYLDDFLARTDDPAYARRGMVRTARWSYERTARAAFRFARELEARVVAKGDRVVIMARNGPEWIAAFLGCVVRGAIAVPLDVKSEPGFVSRVVSLVEAKLAVVDSGTAAVLGGAGALHGTGAAGGGTAGAFGDARAGAAAGAAGAAGGPTTEAFGAAIPTILVDDFEAAIARHSGEPYTSAARDGGAAVEASDTVEIVFTSGTTSEPKGVRITHANLLSNLVPLEDEIRRYLKYERFVHPLRFLNLLPLSHVFGQIMGVFIPQLLGGVVFFQDSLSPAQIVETIRRERVSVLIAVPRILESLREKIERGYEARGKLDRFRRSIEKARGRHPLLRWWTFRRIHSMFGLKFWAVISGGATLDARMEDFWDTLGFAVIQGYGMTETSSLVSVNHPFKLARGSIGQVMPGQEVKLGEDGEILVRGANVSPGYWKSAGGIAAPGDGIAVPEDGWLHTGDLGALDERGYLYFTGRKKDTIVTAAGMKIHPEDLERALDAQSEVAASAVVAFEGPSGAEPLAVLVLRRRDADAVAVVERANALLAEHQRMRRWLVWPDEDFPRTGALKMRRGLVATRAAAMAGGARVAGAAGMAGGAVHATAPMSPESGAVDAIVSRIGAAAHEAHGAREKQEASATLGTDLKLDSLGRIELLSALEDRFQIEIDEAAFTGETTLGEVERMVREGMSRGGGEPASAAGSELPSAAGSELPSAAGGDLASTAGGDLASAAGELPSTAARELTSAGAREEPVPYPYPRWQDRAPVRWLRFALLEGLVVPFTRMLGRARVIGRGNLAGYRGPVVFVANHVTVVDAPLVLRAVQGRLRRRTAIAMDGEILRALRRPPRDAKPWQRIAGPLEYAAAVLFFNVFSMPRKSGFRRSFAFAGELADRGSSILIFPEGKYTTTGAIDRFMAGTGMLIAELGLPVVPARLDGLWELKRAGRRRARPGEIAVHIGTPVTYSPHEDPEAIVADLERRVAGA